MYKLRRLEVFLKNYKRLITRNISLKIKIDFTLEKLSVDPFDQSLQTHKVRTKLSKQAYSSKVTGDLRIIWNFDKDYRIAILLLDLGGHSGKHKVYR